MDRGVWRAIVRRVGKSRPRLKCLRSDRPLVIALASNDAMSQNLGSIAAVLNRKAVYFVPMRQDSPSDKPHSLVAEMELIPRALDSALKGEQIRPLFL